ncbi:MAG: hypothetical protein K0R38_4925 [Polyangiaceae bacterium]|jgi:hypothetical protein|nr:hypothetical protein [Polyangiaceae bacterium]
MKALKSTLGLVVLAFCAAPTPGDIGGCGQEAQELDPRTFFWSLQESQCEQCRDCGIETAACDRACGEVLLQSEFPPNCVPLVHDGEVCLRALQQASCSDSREYVSDTDPSIPPECNFCPAGEGP